MLLNIARSAFNKFTGLVVDHLSTESELDAEQTRGLRNLIREGTRNGGRSNKGYYADLPNGKGSEVTVTDEQIEAAKATAIATVKALVGALAGAGEIESGYTSEGTAYTVTIDTSGFAVPSDEDLNAWMEQAMSGGSGNAALAALDF